MVDSVASVAELGVLTASAEEWVVAVRRAKVIGPVGSGGGCHGSAGRGRREDRREDRCFRRREPDVARGLWGLAVGTRVPS